ncbi:hypothetical protein NL676_011490 [Syzygium grande]|nr:hypothetical protein NL676_011490 [Syzygium grande]
MARTERERRRFAGSSEVEGGGVFCRNGEGASERERGRERYSCLDGHVCSGGPRWWTGPAGESDGAISCDATSRLPGAGSRRELATWEARRGSGRIPIGPRRLVVDEIDAPYFAEVDTALESALFLSFRPFRKWDAIRRRRAG